MKFTSKFLASGIAVSCALLAPHAGFATSASSENPFLIPAAYVEDIGATERINFSGKLRMLSQRIPAAACHLAAGVDVDGARALIEGSTAEFQKIVDALEFGNAEMKIMGAEERRKTIVQIHDLRSYWEPFAASVDQIAKGNADAELVAGVIADSMNVLESAKLLVSEISGEYSNPAEVTQAGALVIDIAGRQRMLTQKMSKESCAAWSGRSPTAASDLAGTMQVFETSLSALINGMPEVGIKPAPTEEIAEGLGAVNKDWNAVKSMLSAVAAGNTPEMEDATTAFQGLNKTMADMNKVVGMYTEVNKSRR